MNDVKPVCASVMTTAKQQKTQTHSSADTYRPPIHVSDWLILCCGNLILHQRKK